MQIDLSFVFWVFYSQITNFRTYQDWNLGFVDWDLYFNIQTRYTMPTYDLEQRTLEFAIAVRKFIKTLPRNLANYEDAKQVIRSSGSVGANYIEANENLGVKDFKMRLKISRKEAKETTYWLKILKTTNEQEFTKSLDYLIKESEALTKILSTIINKTQVSKYK